MCLCVASDLCSVAKQCTVRVAWINEGLGVVVTVMYDMPAEGGHWSHEQLDAYQSSMLSFSDAALGGNIDDLLVDASQAGGSSASLATELNSNRAQETLPPVIDFGVLQAAYGARQPHPPNMLSLDDDDLLPKAQSSEQAATANRTRAARRSGQAQSIAPHGAGENAVCL